MSLIPQSLTVIVAAIVAYIAYQQFVLASERLKFDLFEKRFAIFEAARRFLIAISTDAKLELEDLAEFRRETQPAIFLFDTCITEYLASLAEQSIEMPKTRIQLDPLPIGAERDTLCEKETRLLRELRHELENLSEVFSPLLEIQEFETHFITPVLSWTKLGPLAYPSNL